MKRIALLVVVVTAALALTSCLRSVNVEIVGALPDLEFVVSQPGLGLGRPGRGIGSLEVIRVSPGRAWPPPDWGIRRDSDCSTPTPRFRYGEAPRYWRVWTGPQRLEEGAVYAIVVRGCGFLGGRVFKSVGGRIVSRDGTADDLIKAVQAIE